MIPERQGKRKEENTGEKEMMRKYATTKTKRRKKKQYHSIMILKSRKQKPPLLHDILFTLFRPRGEKRRTLHTPEPKIRLCSCQSGHLEYVTR